MKIEENRSDQMSSSYISPLLEMSLWPHRSFLPPCFSISPQLIYPCSVVHPLCLLKDLARLIVPSLTSFFFFLIGSYTLTYKYTHFFQHISPVHSSSCHINGICSFLAFLAILTLSQNYMWSAYSPGIGEGAALTEVKGRCDPHPHGAHLISHSW